MVQIPTTAPSGKLTAAQVLGIIGGVTGIVAAFLAMMVGGLGEALEAEGAGAVTALGFVAFFLAVLGIVGGALSHSRPKAAAICQLIAGVGGFLAISLFWLLSGPLLVLGAIFAWLGRPKVTHAETA